MDRITLVNLSKLKLQASNTGETWVSALRSIGRQLLPRRLKQIIKTISSGNDSSQAGEAVVIDQLVRTFICKDWVIDVGANDGVTLSNSLEFVKNGWHSILIEPAPAVYKKLAANHAHLKNVICLQVACCENPGEADLYIDRMAKRVSCRLSPHQTTNGSTRPGLHKP